MNQLTSVFPMPSAAAGCATIAPHDVAYDEARSAWKLCVHADIVVGAG